MVLDYIKSVLDSLNLVNVQDTPMGEVQPTDVETYVYTSGEIVSSQFTMGCTNVDMQQGFKIYMVSNDMYYPNTNDNIMGRSLIKIFNTCRSGLPVQLTDSTGSYKITDFIDPEIKFTGLNDKTLRIAEINFKVIWSYDYADI